jgi:uncharacterized protein (TIGR00251 family)
MTRRFRLHDAKHGSALTVRVTPRARKNEFAGILEDGTLRVRIAAPPVEGKANAALVEFLADVLRVRKSKIEIVAGQKGLDKILSIEEMTSEEVEERIRTWIETRQGSTGGEDDPAG